MAENVCWITDKEREIMGTLTREERNPKFFISVSVFSASIHLNSQGHTATIQYLAGTNGKQQLRLMDINLDYCVVLK